MAEISLPLFGTLSGLKEEAIDAAIIGGSALAGLAIAKFVTEQVVAHLPPALTPYRDYIAGAVPFLGALVTATTLRRVNARAAIGASGGMAAYGLYQLAAPFLPTSITGHVPLALHGLGAYAPGLGIRHYLQGAPTTIDALKGAPTTIETLSGSVPFVAALQ